MPSHIFSMLGMWDDLEAADESAAQAWYDYQQAELDGAVTSGELHSLDFLTYAYLQQAKDEKARQAVERRSSVTKFAPRRLGGDNAYAAIPMRYAIERGRWDEAAALEPVDSDFPVARAISHFGRALGAARSGHPDAAAATSASCALSSRPSRTRATHIGQGRSRFSMAPLRRGSCLRRARPRIR
jgi:hypothetical protein